MAFGVKWNETGEESGREFAERGAASPGAGGYSPPPPTRAPGADAGAARRARRLYPPTRPQTGLEGGGGGGTKPSAIFPYSPKHTDTLPGRRLGTERSPAPLPPAPRALAQSGAEEGEPGSPPADRERNRGLAHPPRPPPLRSSCWPRRSASSWRGWLLTARHRRLLFRSRARGGSRQLQDSVPDQGRAWVHPRPGGDWRQSVSRGCGRVNTRELHRGRRNSLLAAPASSSSSAGGGGPLPSSPLGPGLSLSSDRLRAVRFSCVTSSCSSSCSGGFTFPWSPPLSPLRAWSLCCGSLLAPGADRSTGG